VNSLCLGQGNVVVHVKDLSIRFWSYRRISTKCQPKTLCCLKNSTTSNTTTFGSTKSYSFLENFV